VTPLTPLQRSVISSLYLVAAVIVIDQAFDWIGIIQPLRSGLATWRFGAFGTAIGRLGPLAIADSLLLSAALLLDHRRMLLSLCVLHGLISLGLAGGFSLFLLDGLEIRRLLTPVQGREVLIAAARTLATGAVALVTSTVVAVGLFRSQRDALKRERPREGYLVAGSAGAKSDE
jgi:hypothetical protein